MEERERSLLDETNGLLYNGNDIKDTIQDHENKRQPSRILKMTLRLDQIYHVSPLDHALVLAERHANKKKLKGPYIFS
ncbi:protein NETWORKED 2A-like [Dorcoceras hygrometricum]|uniref:Protein NETWORKED 2A-like n=1 Tax=Dorcoceras hygrometricum TaxID=472368 RepID=A0A2Z7B6P6_9LAMI|nr:protein NETWORKED 2A-like [Dorcoceras hygrometricum]